MLGIPRVGRPSDDAWRGRARGHHRWCRLAPPAAGLPGAASRGAQLKLREGNFADAGKVNDQ